MGRRAHRTSYQQLPHRSSSDGFVTPITPSITRTSRRGDDPFRTADAARDGERRGAGMARFANGHAGVTIVEFVPGSAYFTRLFSAIVRGHTDRFLFRFRKPR